MASGRKVDWERLLRCKGMSLVSGEAFESEVGRVQGWSLSVRLKGKAGKIRESLDDEGH